MKAISSLITVSWISLLTACGDTSSQDGAASTPAQAPQPSEDETSQSKTFLGFVANAFDVTVDGVAYKDLEDFYTKEMDALPAKVQAAGYDSSYKITFDASIGFSDLWYGMQVYILSNSDHGYQGQAAVGRNGSFTIDLPTAALNDSYKVRANKRIRVILSNGSDTQTLCYNFSAREKSVPFEETSKPIILDSFDSSLTKYDCPTNENKDGLNVPKNTETKLKPGLSKAQVLGVLGSVGLTIKDSQTWCWDDVQTKESICSAHYYSVCSCSASFSSDGKLVSTENIQSKYLEILAW